MIEPDDQTEALETDERFPSGEWTGFFLQPWNFSGRQWMSLTLSFAAGRISGEGSDIVGEFLIKGRYETSSGDVWMSKRYIGKHDLDYRGYNEAGKGIWGTWTLRNIDRGGFHIWPKGMADPTKSRLAAEADAPVEEDSIEVAVPAGAGAAEEAV